MLDIQCFVVNMVEENCYVVSDSTREAVVIDCGVLTRKEEEAFQSYVTEKKLTLTHLLCTHAHFDHIFGAEFIYRTYGLKPEIHGNDAMLYAQAAVQTRTIMHQEMEWTLPPHEISLTENDVITFGTHQLKVIATPGHTQGGVCFYCPSEQILFSGDSLFQSCIGRTDLPGGNGPQLVEALCRKILTLPPETRVYPGHGPSTSIGYERRFNAYLR